MDLEGYARRMLSSQDKEAVKEKLAQRIIEIKGWSKQEAEDWAEAVTMEIENAYTQSSPLLDYYHSNITMGGFGVGSRGRGDFYVHSKLADVIGDSSAIISSKDLDDAGVVKKNGLYFSVAIDGIHSRLSEFPFVAGFHVARAAMRDVYVMGTRPVTLFSDIHIGDDGDISKIFDHVAGISAVCELTGVPLVAGSTLRIGGDMVIGERMTGGVGCAGIGGYITARKNVEEGDVILLTEGAGGGTIATTAIYYGMHDVVEETMNVDFLTACDSLLNSDLIPRIHSMSDVTNGGIRGDAEEISGVSNTSLIFDMDKVREMINPSVLEMLDGLEIDFMGLSIDSLMVICPPEVAKKVKKVVMDSGIKIDEVGWVEKGQGCYTVEDEERKPLKPRFRESAYTPLKKVVGENEPSDFEEMREEVDKAVNSAVNKKKDIIKKIRRKQH